MKTSLHALSGIPSNKENALEQLLSCLATALVDLRFLPLFVGGEQDALLACLRVDAVSDIALTVDLIFAGTRKTSTVYSIGLLRVCQRR